MRTAPATKKISRPARPTKRPISPYSSFLNSKLAEIAKLLKNFDGELSRGQVHRLRVGTRRLQAILEVLKTGPHSGLAKRSFETVKFLTNQLGEIRSLDVSRKLWKDQFSDSGIDRELKKLAREERSELSKKIGKKEKSDLEKALGKIRLSLRGDSAGYRRAWAKRLAKAEGRAARSYSDYRAKPDIETLHELRIRLKQWRYLLELSGPETKNSANDVAILKALQDDIGELHDKEVLRELLKKRRIKRVAQKSEGGHDLKEIRRGLQAEIEEGQRTFLHRQHSTLARIFSKEPT